MVPLASDHSTTCLSKCASLPPASPCSWEEYILTGHKLPHYPCNMHALSFYPMAESCNCCRANVTRCSAHFWFTCVQLMYTLQKSPESTGLSQCCVTDRRCCSQFLAVVGNAWAPLYLQRQHNMQDITSGTVTLNHNAWAADGYVTGSQQEACCKKLIYYVVCWADIREHQSLQSFEV